jgi:hypothetical protein
MRSLGALCARRKWIVLGCPARPPAKSAPAPHAALGLAASLDHQRGEVADLRLADQISVANGRRRRGRDYLDAHSTPVQLTVESLVGVTQPALQQATQSGVTP